MKQPDAESRLPMEGEPAAQEPTMLTVREMIVEGGIDPADIYGLEECGDLKVVGSVDWTYLLENGVLLECEHGIRLLLDVFKESNPHRHFTIEPAATEREEK
jgi:hypothetical protein